MSQHVEFTALIYGYIRDRDYTSAISILEVCETRSVRFKRSSVIYAHDT